MLQIRIDNFTNCKLWTWAAVTISLLTVATIFSTFSTLAYAQTSATLAGRVTDTQGANVAGAQVEILDATTNQRRVVATNDEGRYAFAGLEAGTYQVTVTRNGFQTAIKDSIVINVASRVREDFSLVVGGVAESVTIESDASLIERESGEVGTTVDRTFIENLPLNGRSFQTLIELTPGVVLAETSIFAPGQFSVNGQRTNTNYFTVDGVSANVTAGVSAQGFQQAAGALPGLTILGGTNSLVSVDALQEFRVLTSSYAPEYGRSPGAQVILKTRSGTNDYTGTLFNYFRNEAFDANDFFNNAAGTNPATGKPFLPRLPLRQNNFGGVFGGAVILPRFGEGTPPLYSGRDKTFFFVSYEGLRLRQPQLDARLAYVPSVEARNHATGAIRSILNAFPLPNAPAQAGDPANTGRLIQGSSYPSSFDIFSLRIDQRAGNKLNLFARVNDAPSRTATKVFANQENDFQLDTRTSTVGATMTFSPRVTNELRANYSTSGGLFGFVGREEGGAILPDDSLLYPSFTSRTTSRASIQLGSFLAGSDFAPPNLTVGKAIGATQQQINIVNDATFQVGNHQLKFGADFRRLNPSLEASDIGITYFFGSVTAALSGIVPRVTIQGFAPTGEFNFNNYSFYGQDTWRATSRLTLTYGARYELNPPPSGARLPFMLSDTDNLLTTTLAPANTRAYETTYNNFAPRVGIAYQFPRINDLVIRGGIGRFYDLGNTAVLRGYRSFPFNSSRTTLNVPFPVPEAVLNPNPFDTTTTPYSAEFYVTERDLKLPYTIQYNVAVEKGLGRNQTITVSYVGADARRLLRTEFLRNQPARTNPARPAVTVINPSLFGTGTGRTSEIRLTRNASESAYDALQAQFQRRLSNGFQALASYTLAKSIDDVSDETVDTLPIIFEDRRLTRAASAFDIRHTLTTAATYELPSFGGNTFINAVTRNFALDGFFRFRSAPPLDVISSVDLLNLGLRSGVRPNLVSEVPLYLEDPTAPDGRRINRAAFAIPAAGQQGDVGRNFLRGFSAHQLDLALRRQFFLTENVRVQFRAELFNALNTANFARPVSDLASGSFGQPTRTLARSLGAGGSNGGFNPLYQFGGARSAQFALKLLF